MAADPQTLRVFISSAVYDLIDVRAELSAHLAAMGVTPVLSDDKLSDFRVQQEMNSIATCLVNVDSCDEFILVLDQRYGPKLGKSGFDDVSATHLEYRRAIESGRPIHVFVRDRLAAEYSIWKKNKRSEAIGLAWVESEDFGLFQLLDEHAKLSAERRESNWYSTFANSIDLKAAISNQFESRLLPGTILDAIRKNQFPLLDVRLEATDDVQPRAPRGYAPSFRTVKYAARVRNIGGSAAFNFRVYWGEEPKKSANRTIMAPGQEVPMVVLMDDRDELNRSLIAEYESPLGVAVHETYSVQGFVESGVVMSGVTLKNRKFFRCEAMDIQIQENAVDQTCPSRE